jgi:hypothetical protein
MELEEADGLPVVSDGLRIQAALAICDAQGELVRHAVMSALDADERCHGWIAPVPRHVRGFQGHRLSHGPGAPEHAREQ